MANFSPYQSRGQLSAPTVNFVRTGNPHYSNAGEQALAKESGNAGLVVMGGLLKMKEQYDNGKILEANNEYNRLMSEGTAELLQRKEENALNVVEDYDTLHKKTLDQVRKKYGAWISYGEAGQAFTAYTERDNNTRRGNMLKYQMAETDKYHETQYNNQLASCLQMVGDGGGSDEAINAAYNRGIGLLQNRYAPYGEEKIKEQERVFRGQLAKSALALAIGQNDYKRMGEIADRYRDSLDPSARIAALSTLGKRQKEETELGEASDIIARYGIDVDFDTVKEYVRGKNSSGDGVTAFHEAARSLLGVTMENERVGCCEGVVRVLSQCSTFGENNSEQVRCGNLLSAAAQEGSGASVLRYNGQQLQPGDVIVYFEKGDDTSVYDNAAHVVLADGNGGYYGNSSSELDYENENGETVRGPGCFVHKESTDIGGLEIGYIIRVDELQGKAMSELDVEERAASIYKRVETQRNRVTAENRRKISDADTALKQMILSGDLSGIDNLPMQYGFNADGTVNEKVMTEVQWMVATEKERQQKAAERAAKGQPSEKIDSEMMEFLERNVANGASKQEVTEWLVSHGVTSDKELSRGTKLVDDFMKGAGIFKLPLKSIRDSIPEYQFAKGAEKAALGNSLDRIAKYEYRAYLSENNGNIPDDIENIVPEIVERVKKAYTEMYASGYEYNWFSNLDISKADLIASGYYPWFTESETMIPGVDTAYKLIRIDGTGEDYKSADEIMKMKGAAGRVKR